MASQRLTNDDRENIVKNILKPVEKELSQKIEDFSKNILEPFLIRETPDDIKVFRAKYKDLIPTREYFYFSDFSKREDRRYIHIPVSNFIPNFHNKEDVIDRIMSLKEGVKFVREVEQLKEKLKSLKGRTRCVLDNINTTKQLKDQFPEAYLILMNIPKEKIQDNSCDNIENLRAELSKYNK